MILPFVREFFADVEKVPAFARAVTEVKGGTGRIRVSGLTPTGKALFYSLLQRATSQPLVVVVSDNRAVDELLPLVRSLADLTGAGSPDAVVGLPAYDVLPFREPVATSWRSRKRALQRCGRSRPARPRSSSRHWPRLPCGCANANFYADLAKVVRRGEMIESERLLEHLRIVGYNQVDVVEMPGEFAHRGGLIDVYPPESDRPVRIELFGDEVESIRKFDPETQRSAASTDEVVLLPLTETPVEEETLAAINARLTGERLAGSEELIERTVRATGVAVFPGWELYAPVAGAREDFFDLLPNATVILDEPDALEDVHDAWWTKVTEAHERSLVGNLVRPEELYLSPEQWHARLRQATLLAVEQLGIEDSNDAEHLVLQTQPTTRFHGSVAAMTEEVARLTREGKRVMFAVSSTGEVERLADVFNEYNVSFRIGSRTPKPGNEVFVDESTYFAEDVAATTIVKAYVPEGVALPEANLVLFGARDLFDESEVSLGRPQRQKSKVSAFLSDFRDLADRRLRRARRARHRPVPGPEGDSAGRRRHGRVHDSGVCRGRAAVCAADATRPGAEVPLVRRREAGAEPAGHAAVAEDQGAGEEGHEGHGRGAAEALRCASHGRGPCVCVGQRMAGRVRRQLRVQRDRRSDECHRRREARHGGAHADGSPAVRRCGLWQDGSGHARGVQGGQRQSPGCGAGADDGARLPALQHLPPALCRLPHQDRNAQPLPHGEAAEGNDCQDRGRRRSI